jgi:hypothetical protein
MLAVTVGGTGASDGKIYTRVIGSSTNVVTGQVSGGSAPDGLTLFGRSSGDATEWFNGGLAYVRVWSAVLSQAEIEAEWASSTIVRTSGVWANWPLLTDLTDISGNGRNLTAGTTALSTEDDPPLGSTVTGTGSAAFGGLTASASGVRSVVASAAASFGGMGAAALGTIPTAATGSWYGLASILKEGVSIHRQERSSVPVACPDCGEPLRSGPRGEMFCLFDGSLWGAGDRRLPPFREVR